MFEIVLPVKHCKQHIYVIEEYCLLIYQVNTRRCFNVETTSCAYWVMSDTELQKENYGCGYKSYGVHSHRRRFFVRLQFAVFSRCGLPWFNTNLPRTLLSLLLWFHMNIISANQTIFNRLIFSFFGQVIQENLLRCRICNAIIFSTLCPFFVSNNLQIKLDGWNLFFSGLISILTSLSSRQGFCSRDTAIVYHTTSNSLF